MDFEEAYALFKNNGSSGGDVTKAYVDAQDALKVDKVTGKGLSTNDYTTEEKQKLAGLNNYDDTEIQTAISEMASVIPASATPQNLLATSADVSGADISASSASSTLTNSADGMVQGLTVYGSSEVDGGSVSSVGDNGLTITTSNSDNTVTTSSAVTTALPLRGIDDMADILTVSAATGSVTSKFGAVDLSTLTWEGMGTAGETKQLYKAAIPDMLQPAVASQRNTYILCDTYSVSAVTNYTLMDARTCLRVSIRICFRRQRRGIVTRSRQRSRSGRKTPRTEMRTVRPRKKRHKICTFS